MQLLGTACVQLASWRASDWHGWSLVLVCRWRVADERLESGWRAADEQLARATCWQELECSKQPVSSWCAVASGWRVGKEERLVCCWRVAHERLASGWRAVGERLASGQHAGTGVRLARSWRAAG